MVVSYTAEGNTFRASHPQKWCEERITERPGPRSFDLHPDGDRLVVSGDLPKADVDKVVLVFNFFDDLRRRLSDASR
jgi:hypothetical protein